MGSEGKLSKWLRDIRTKQVKPYIKGDVLDVGCGPAANYYAAKRKITSYYGIEGTRVAVEALQKKLPHCHFSTADLDKDILSLNKKFDRILLVAVIEHIFNQKHLMEQLVKHLKPRGKIIITTPTAFGNDVVHRIGSALGLFSRSAHDDHIVIYNKERFGVLAQEFNLQLVKYKTFELGCNQIAVLKNK
jgi:2-polyprenyl-3-methyl-5-hydroxy-6-metoxy-1,4-benzoquinol methylase